MRNKKWIIISSAIALVLIVTVAGVTRSKADSNKVNLNSDAADHGSVILQDGSSSKDIVIKDEKVPSASTPSVEKDAVADIYNDIATNGRESYIDDMNDYVDDFLEKYDAQKDSNVTKYDEQKDSNVTECDEQGNGAVNLNEDALDHGSVVLPGGASSRDVVIGR